MALLAPQEPPTLDRAMEKDAFPKAEFPSRKAHLPRAVAVAVTRLTASGAQATMAPCWGFHVAEGAENGRFCELAIDDPILKNAGLRDGDVVAFVDEHKVRGRCAFLALVKAFPGRIQS